jgi:hypothetical protein
LLLQFQIKSPILKLILTLGPGEASIRQAVFESLENQNILGFTGQKPTPDVKWLTLVARIISDNISPAMFISDIEDDVRQFWQQFLTDELPSLHSAG